MKVSKYLLAAVVAASLSFPANAKSIGAAHLACYTPAQLQAEQLLRLHSELMVITVTCKSGSQGEDLGAAYGGFTKRHITVLHDAEQTMVGYYKTAPGKGSPMDRLDRLRTMLANEFGQKAADMQSSNFCAEFRDKPVKYQNLEGADVQNEVQRMVIANRAYVPVCSQGTAAVRN